MAKILIVEDEPLAIRMIEKALTFEKHEVIAALGGQEGIDKALQEKPDLVLLDIMMPEPNGIEVLKKIRANAATASTPVIMLTNLSGEYDKKLAQENGASDFWVKKDVDYKKLGSRISQFLDFTNNQKEKRDE